MQFDRLARRAFITLLGTAATWPLAAHAQQASMPVIGYLGPGTLERSAARLRALRQSLSEAGFVEGRNVAIEYRWADYHNENIPALAADLVHRQVNVITTGGVPAALATRAATRTIPIVFSFGVDPVALGLVASLNRPGGNITGVANLGGELGAKRLELIHELVPGANPIGLLLNPSNLSTESQTRDMQAAAQTLGVRLQIVHASAERDFDAAFASLLEARAGALVIGNDALLINRSEQIAALALRHAMPAVYQFPEFAAAGGLISYGGSDIETSRLVGDYTSRILKGEKPGDLPVQQATRTELIINMKTAKALGLTFPLALLGRADEVIE
ncbi:MAG TPA: ABC transporter substrate-binding protein [Xanthobacteraceae bacterium]|jgi:putative ABC transport system substrate-binding protein